MKALFGSLLCLVLATSQSYAVKGGPTYGVASTNLIGTYAAVLIPQFDPTDPFSTNSIGVFAASVPDSGLASGGFAFFARGQIFLGTMTGVGDPKGGTLKGILQADTGDQPLDATDELPGARGKLNARVVSEASRLGRSAIRLRGDATLFVDQGNVNPATGQKIVTAIYTLAVEGFKQSDTATSVTLPNTLGPST